MTGTLERLASKLADDTMAAMIETGNERLYIEVGNVLGSSSQSLEDAFLTEMRVRLSEQQARKFLNQKISTARAQAAAQKQS